MNTHTTYSAQRTVHMSFWDGHAGSFCIWSVLGKLCEWTGEDKTSLPSSPNTDKRADDTASAETMLPADWTVLRVSSPAGWTLKSV